MSCPVTDAIVCLACPLPDKCMPNYVMHARGSLQFAFERRNAASQQVARNKCGNAVVGTRAELHLQLVDRKLH